MNKLDMAHEYLRDIISNWEYDESFNPVAEAWKYADLMQEEYKKREPTGLSEELLTKKPNGMCESDHTTLNRTECFDCGEVLKGTESSQLDWQPDWSQAPEWAKYWCMHSSNGTCYWTESQPIKKWDEFSILRNEQSPTFNYRGDWKQSLRERPKDNKVESGYVQQIPRPFLVNGCDVGNLDLLKEGLRSGLKEASKETTPKVEVKSKQHSCNCPHWEGSSFFMGDTFTCNDCGGVVMI